MNQTENRYYRRYIFHRHAQREGRAFAHESIPLKLAHTCIYSPDFPFELNNKRMEYHEVKGAHHYDDAAVKFKCASTIYPNDLFVWAKLMNNDRWKIQHWMGGERVNLEQVEEWRAGK